MRFPIEKVSFDEIEHFQYKLSVSDIAIYYIFHHHFGP